MVLICNGPEIVLRCGTCGAEIKHVGYDLGQPWPNAEALGWGVSQDPRGKPGWDHRCPECLAEIANQNEPMDAGEDRAPDQDNPQKRGPRQGQNPTIALLARRIAVFC